MGRVFRNYIESEIGILTCKHCKTHLIDFKHCKYVQGMEVFMCYHPLINVSKKTIDTHTTLAEQGYSFSGIMCDTCRNEVGWNVEHDTFCPSIVATIFLTQDNVELSLSS